jgi:hypothetical protein
MSWFKYSLLEAQKEYGIHTEGTNLIRDDIISKLHSHPLIAIDIKDSVFSPSIACTILSPLGRGKYCKGLIGKTFIKIINSSESDKALIKHILYMIKRNAQAAQ